MATVSVDDRYDYFSSYVETIVIQNDANRVEELALEVSKQRKVEDIREQLARRGYDTEGMSKAEVLSAAEGEDIPTEYVPRDEETNAALTRRLNDYFRTDNTTSLSNRAVAQNKNFRTYLEKTGLVGPDGKPLKVRSGEREHDFSTVLTGLSQRKYAEAMRGINPERFPKLIKEINYAYRGQPKNISELRNDIDTELGRRGVPVPFVGETADDIRAQAAELGIPLNKKPLWVDMRGGEQKLVKQINASLDRAAETNHVPTIIAIRNNIYNDVNELDVDQRNIKDVETLNRLKQRTDELARPFERFFLPPSRNKPKELLVGALDFANVDRSKVRTYKDAVDLVNKYNSTASPQDKIGLRMHETGRFDKMFALSRLNIGRQYIEDMKPSTLNERYHSIFGMIAKPKPKMWAIGPELEKDKEGTKQFVKRVLKEVLTESKIKDEVNEYLKDVPFAPKAFVEKEVLRSHVAKAMEKQDVVPWEDIILSRFKKGYNLINKSAPGPLPDDYKMRDTDYRLLAKLTDTNRKVWDRVIKAEPVPVLNKLTGEPLKKRGKVVTERGNFVPNEVWGWGAGKGKGLKDIFLQKAEELGEARREYEKPKLPRGYTERAINEAIREDMADVIHDLVRDDPMWGGVRLESKERVAEAARDEILKSTKKVDFIKIPGNKPKKEGGEANVL